jgi:protein dithiol oxidoreductase (disulfide-forming)
LQQRLTTLTMHQPSSFPRRDFALSLGAVALATMGPASAQSPAPQEGRQFVRLGQPVNVNAPAGKIEVLEFFWYGCPACNALEPALEEWIKRLPADVAFRRVPVGFSAVHETHSRLFYALEAMGALEQMHKRVFAAIHQGRQRLDRVGEQAEFVKANGLDPAKFEEMQKSFSVQSRSRQAKQLAEAYKIDGVPAIGVHGRFYTAGSLAGGGLQALAVADFLINRVRRGG